jgi:hypothetical protein
MRTLLLIFICIICAQMAKGQIQQDKALHFLGGNLYGMVGAGVADQISKGDRTWTFVGSLGGSLLIGLAKEAIDESQYGGWDNQDLLATVLGGASVGVTIDVFKQRKKRKREKLFRDAVSVGMVKVQNESGVLENENSQDPTLQLLGFSRTMLHRLIKD